jgi:hypothetical protein
MNQMLNVCIQLYLIIIEFTYLPAWLLYNNGHQPNNILWFSKGHFFLVGAKHKSIYDGGIYSYWPKAIGQAIAWANVTGFVMFDSQL